MDNVNNSHNLPKTISFVFPSKPKALFCFPLKQTNKVSLRRGHLSTLPLPVRVPSPSSIPRRSVPCRAVGVGQALSRTGINRRRNKGCFLSSRLGSLRRPWFVDLVQLGRTRTSTVRITLLPLAGKLNPRCPPTASLDLQIHRKGGNNAQNTNFQTLTTVGEEKKTEKNAKETNALRMGKETETRPEADCRCPSLDIVTTAARADGRAGMQ